MNLKQVMTRLVRGKTPPTMQYDSNGNPVIVAVGRGLLGVSAQP